MLLYIHIPFCEKKCDYCDFLSFAGISAEVKEKYIDALLDELEFYDNMEFFNEEISSVFIGGGTPSSLDIYLLEKLLSRICSVCKIPSDNKKIEYTIECNPGTLNEDKLKIFKKYGINRISIGLQSADNNMLKELGRIHTFEEFVENYYLARKLGFNNINIDLMSALPGQSMKQWKDTLEKVVRLAPEHISAYSLIIEEGTKFFELYNNNEEKLPDEETDREMYSFTKEFLREMGYERYEISNYSKKGFECKHNTGYWTREEYIGIGLGASSFIKEKRYSVTGNINKYLNSNKKCISLKSAEWIDDMIELSEEEQISEFIFLGLRLIHGISVTDFENKFNKNLISIYKNEFNEMFRENLLEFGESENIVKLTDKGLDLSNYVFAFFV